MQQLSIHDFKIETIIGIHPWEKKIPQTLFITLNMQKDFTQAFNTDDITTTVDYTQAAQFIQKFCEENHFNLVETLAYQLATALKQEFKLSVLKLSLEKFGVIPQAKKISFSILLSD